jgi:hypothetical protein
MIDPPVRSMHLSVTLHWKVPSVTETHCWFGEFAMQEEICSGVPSALMPSFTSMH